MIGTVIMISIAVIVASVASVFILDVGDSSQEPAPKVTVSYERVDDGSEQTIAITLESGEAVRTDKLYVTGSEDLDIGGAPGSSSPADDQYSSSLEKFTESSGGNPPQVGIGDTWESGETVYIDPDGGVEGTTVRIYWSSKPVEGVNPGTPSGETSYRIAELTV